MVNIQHLPVANAINAVLIVLSAAVAYWFPFELFLFAYGVLGPIHYFTEINWLHRKDYFLKKTDKQIYLWIMVVVMALFTWYNFSFITGFDGKAFSDFFKSYSRAILLSTVVLATLLVWSKLNSERRVLYLAASVVILMVVQTWTVFGTIALMLPTLIHVSLFTWLFMVQGAIKNPAWHNYAVAGIYLLVGIVLLAIPPFSNSISQFFQASWTESRMEGINTTAQTLFGIDKRNADVFSNLGMRIQGFIAFAYTYHYLNWFSKVEVIKWHKELTTKKLAIVVLLSITSIGLYIYSYSVGVLVLLAVSLLHVLLELPLNVITAKQVFGSLRTRLK
jgi:hypothetical protein